MMDDLKNAILDVLKDAEYDKDYDYYVVDAELLRTLQAEYNIYFVEPDRPQVDLL